MSKSPRVIVSIFTISILILPAVFLLTVYLPQFFIDTMTTTFGDCSTFFTVITVISLVLVLGPPWRKHHRAVFSKALNLIFKKFLRRTSKEDVVFKDDILQFATAEESTDEPFLENEFPETTLEISNNFITNNASQRDGKQITKFSKSWQFQQHLLRHYQQNKTSTFFPISTLTFLLKNSNFELNSTFLRQYFCKRNTCSDLITAGRASRNASTITGHNRLLDSFRSLFKMNIRGN